MQLIGKIISAHGLKGEVVFHHNLKKNTRFQTWDCVLVELNKDSFIPFFIEQIKPVNLNECICKFEEVKSREETRPLLNKAIYTSVNYRVETNVLSGLEQYLGYALFNNDTFIGSIVETMDSNLNPMFVIEYETKKVFIPANEALIQKTDTQNKTIYMQLPEGLLDI